MECDAPTAARWAEGLAKAFLQRLDLRGDTGPNPAVGDEREPRPDVPRPDRTTRQLWAAEWVEGRLAVAGHSSGVARPFR